VCSQRSPVCCLRVNYSWSSRSLGVNTTFGVFDENIDQEKRRLLSLSLRANGGSDEEAGLDDEEEENNGEDIPDSLNNQITIYYYLPHLPRPLHSFRVYSLDYFLVESVYGSYWPSCLLSTCFRIISAQLMSMSVSIHESLSKSRTRHMNTNRKTPPLPSQTTHQSTQHTQHIITTLTPNQTHHNEQLRKTPNHT
jgi:hypothetical protein